MSLAAVSLRVRSSSKLGDQADSLSTRSTEIQLNVMDPSDTTQPDRSTPPGVSRSLTEGFARDSLLQRIAAGDTAAVDECLDQYGGLVWSLSKRYCRSSADAEDAAQDIFVELWKNAGRFDPAKAGESTFVAMIARRRLIDRHRRGQSAPDTISMSETVAEFQQQDEVDRVELSDEAAKATACMEKLSSNQQKILKLSIHQCEPHSSISSMLKMPLGTVKSYARRGLLQLRECMERPATPEAAS